MINLSITIIVFIVVVVLLCMYEATYFPTPTSLIMSDKFGSICGDCRGRSIGQCMNCSNCGFVSKGGFGKCIEGDMFGPYEYDPTYESARWISGDPFWTDVLVSDNIVRPAPHIYPNFYRKRNDKSYVFGYDRYARYPTDRKDALTN